MKKPYVVFCLLFSLAMYAQQRPVLSASVDKASILIGEPLQLTLQATFSNPHTTSFFTTDSLPHFEILSKGALDSQVTGGTVLLKQTITLTSWDSGTWAIPAFSLPGNNKAATKPLVVTVNYTATPQDYHDIKDILEVARPQRQTWYWYVIGAVLLLLIVLLLFPRKKKESAADATPAPETALRTALKQLDALRLKTDLDDKDYFTELVEIFRTYLQQRKGIHSFQQTTDDLSRQLQTLDLPHEDLKKLVQTLQLSDFVKFAQLSATTADRDAAWHDIKTNITSIEQLK